MSDDIKTPKKRRVGDGTPGPGRPKGVQNKTTTILKDAIIQAATEAGGKDGMVGYLKLVAAENPAAFSTLLGKVLPMQINHADAEGGKISFIIRDMTKDA